MHHRLPFLASFAAAALAACSGGGGGGTGGGVVSQGPPHVFTLTAAANGQPITSSAAQPASARVGTVIVTETNYSGSFTITGGASGCIGYGQDAPPNANYFNFAPATSTPCRGVIDKFTFSDTIGNSIDLYLQV
jgi:hypothetical protein